MVIKVIKKLRHAAKNKIFSYILPSNFYFSHKGYCPCCDKKVVFYSENPWLRDYFICSHCFSIPRERALIVILEKYFPHWRQLVIHESSPINRGASLKLKNCCRRYMPTQYYSDQPLGAIVNNHRNEDLEKQTFSDGSFDIVITQDVMEHIYDPEKAFSEIARTLKRGGAHIFNTPLINKHKKTEVWATKGQDGKPQFLKNPEYHANPVDPKGSPVTMHWGYDIVNFIRDKSGLETIIEHIEDLNHGIKAELMEILISKKM